MSQPAAYTPVHSFVADSATVPNFPGQALDVEFNDVKITTDQIRANLALIQRDDGAIANSSISYDQLSPALQTAGLTPASAWITATNYSVNANVVQGWSLYRGLVQHVSGVFATDLAAGKWALIATLPAAPAAGQLPGTATNDNAGAGDVGEYLESVVAVGSAVPLVNATPKDITTLTLSPGDWEITASVNVLGSGTTSFSGAIGSISPTLNTLDTTPLAFGIVTYGASPVVTPAATAGVLNMNCGPVRKSLSVSTPFHLVGQGMFTLSTATAWGTIRARRLR